MTKVYEVSGTASANSPIILTAKTLNSNVAMLTGEVSINNLDEAWDHRITFTKNTTTLGSLALTVKFKNAGAAQLFKSDGATIVVAIGSLTEPATYLFSGDIEEFIITPSALNGTFTYSMSGRD